MKKMLYTLTFLFVHKYEKKQIQQVQNIGLDLFNVATLNINSADLINSFGYSEDYVSKLLLPVLKGENIVSKETAEEVQNQMQKLFSEIVKKRPDYLYFDVSTIQLKQVIVTEQEIC